MNHDLEKELFKTNFSRSAMIMLLMSIGFFAFNIPLAKASGTIYIRADGSMDPSNAPISTLDNTTYTLTDNIIAEADGIVIERNNIVFDGAGYTVLGNGEFTGIALSDKINVTVMNVHVEKFYYGLGLIGLLNCSVSGNNITANTMGMALYFSNNTKVTDNFVDNTKGTGVDIWQSSYNSIFRNEIANTGVIGIQLVQSSNNNMSNNEISNSTFGVSLLESALNGVVGNNISANTYSGMRLDSSTNNNITGNTVMNNQYCLELYSSNNNTFHHNNFVKNTVQAQIHLNSVNTWDNGYPSGGNYWGFSGQDTHSGPYQNENGSDEIIDTPYILDANNQDRYPLTHFYPEKILLPTDLNRDGKVDIIDITTVAVAYWARNVTDPSDPRNGQYWHDTFCKMCPHDPHCDINTDGIINIVDIVAVAVDYGE